MTALRFLRFFFVGAKAREPGAPPAPPRTRSRRGARRALVAGAVLVLAVNGLALLALSDARVRDPEYGRRATRLRDRVKENPTRPVVVVLGSSRTAMGVSPTEWEATRPNDPSRPDPLLFNMANLGGGPVMELMTLRRLYADGFRPNVVLIEYWPAFFHYEDGWAEPNRIVTDRLMECDRQLVRDYFPDPARTEAAMDARRLNPLFANRERLLMSAMPSWIPPVRRADAGWTGLDPWGWLPGYDLKPDQTDWRAQAVENCSKIYRPVFAKYRISPVADRAVREAVALARENGAAVGFVFLPESSEFRNLYPQRVTQRAGEHLSKLSRELNVPVIDCRDWMPDGSIVDGFHLSKVGAGEFTRKLGPAIAKTFGAQP